MLRSRRIRRAFCLPYPCPDNSSKIMTDLLRRWIPGYYYRDVQTSRLKTSLAKHARLNPRPHHAPEARTVISLGDTTTPANDCPHAALAIVPLIKLRTRESSAPWSNSHPLRLIKACFLLLFMYICPEATWTGGYCQRYLYRYTYD